MPSLRIPPYLDSPIFSGMSWVAHGFGTRNSAPLAGDVSRVKQIHSNLALLAEQPGVLGEGDAIVTNRPGLAISIRTADCYPILLADARNRAIAAIHAGWRGTAAEIVSRTLEKMKAEFGTEPADVLAAIGPGIDVCCYEVGEDVATIFGLAMGAHLDLISENWKQLERAGVAPQNIQALDVCTFCDAERVSRPSDAVNRPRL